MKSLLTVLLIFSMTYLSANCSFQTALFNEMNKLNKGKNLIISPLSIFQALSLTTNGAKGKTQKEMLEALEIDSVEELNKINYALLEIFQEFTTVEVANAVMSRFTPLESFVEITEKYCAPIEPLKSVEQVNNWCSEKTHGKIKKLLNKLEDDVMMILLNAVYFKGIWEAEFDKERTFKNSFYNLGSEEIEVDTMRELSKYKYYEDENIQAIELPYKNDSMSAVIILPSKENEINKYINTLANSEDKLSSIIKGLKVAKVRLELPKFELEFETSVKESLEDMGMVTPFSGAADFSGLIEDESLFISDVIHKTYLKVDEEGTEAAAVTGVIISKGGSIGTEEKIFEMKVNRPFLFLIRNAKMPVGYEMMFMSKIEKLN